MLVSVVPNRRSGARRGALLPLAALVVAVAGAPAVAAADGVRGASHMVVSAEGEATKAGLEVLRDGGNAIDAALATALALTVTYPEAAPLGGGGFLLLRRPDGSVEALDFRETAPRALTKQAFLGRDGRPDPAKALEGGLAIGVPGTAAGFFEAHRRWGRASWADVLRPAIRLAERGIVVTPDLEDAIREEAARLDDEPRAGAAFLRDGAALRAGERLVQRDLAKTLKRLASKGPDGFYRGKVAREIAAAVRAWGGPLDEHDLAEYRPVARKALAGSYRGHRLAVFPPPSSGGIALLQILGMLERFDVKASGSGTAGTIHRIAEAERRAFADRATWLGDPAFVRVPLAGLLDPGYLAARAATIAPGRSTPSSEIAAGEPPQGGTDTTHLSVADRDGNAVALTVTLNSSFGCAKIAGRTGVLLNNEIDDFALAPGVPNQFGLVGGEANAVAGNKRPLSSMCPTIVEPKSGGPRPMLVLGSRGGSVIITSVAQAIVNVVDHGMDIARAVEAPRFHHQWLPDRIDFEPGALDADTQERLRAMGHVLAERKRQGHVNAIGLTQGGAWLGAADPRRGGLAAGD